MDFKKELEKIKKDVTIENVRHINGMVYILFEDSLDQKVFSIELAKQNVEHVMKKIEYKGRAILCARDFEIQAIIAERTILGELIGEEEDAVEIPGT